MKAKRATRERPISFTKMDDIKNRWETTSQQGRREVQREARKEEIAGIRSRLFMVIISRSFSSSFDRHVSAFLFFLFFLFLFIFFPPSRKDRIHSTFLNRWLAK